MKKLQLITLCSLLLFGFVGICLAENQPGSPPDPAKMEVEFKSGLDKLVADNVITEKQETTIIKYFQDMRDKNGPPPQPTNNSMQSQNDPLSVLVKDGIITQEQANAIQKVLPKPPAPMK
jgi:hypothetical protein